MRLVESVRAYTFWRDVSQDSPSSSFLELHDILASHFLFIVAARIQIVDPQFHEFDTTKFPLYCVTSLKNLGKSSKTLTYNIFQYETDRHFVSCDVTDVLVSMTERKPVSYPDDWLSKYGKDTTNFRRNELLPDLDPGKTETNKSLVRVTYSDTDTYQHANWSSYLKYCYNSLYEHLFLGKGYTYVTQEEVLSGYRDVEMLFRNEANIGDIIFVQSWSEKAASGKSLDPGSVLFRLVNEAGNSCFEAKMTFYPVSSNL